MFAVFRKAKPADAAEPQVQAEEVTPQATAIDMRAAIDSISKEASNMGREAAEVRGLMEDTQKLSTRQAQALQALAGQVQEITTAQDGIGSVSKSSLAAVERARKAVEDVGNEVGGIVSTLRQVSQAAGTITQIALQTRLVAFNASVEAKRAGEAGRGFGVVADAVKDLAAKVESSSKEIMSTVGELDARIEALSREIRVQEGQEASKGGFHAALADVQSGVTSISGAAEQSHAICGRLNQRMNEIEAEIHETGRSLDLAMGRSESFLKVSEHLIEMVAQCGIETEDTPYIAAAIEAAGQVSKLLEDSLRTSTISMSDLFDESYRPIPRTNPAQHTTRFIDLADRLFPQVQERMLAISPKVVFCIASDRNGYIATHNKKYCHVQRGDLVWDTANSRYRRIFNDRTGLASSRNQRPFLLQTYRRDMGGGNFVVMKEAAAPITVNGKHWGGLRLAFHF